MQCTVEGTIIFFYAEKISFTEEFTKRVMISRPFNSDPMIVYTPTCNLRALYYRRLHLPVNARAQNMFSRDVKRLSFRRQTLKFSRPNVKFPL